jgi:rRNA maturation endonuclease Nob1
VEFAAGTDSELQALELALDGSRSLRELREAGIGGACENCGAVHGSSDHYCASCGEPLRRGPDDEQHSDET